MYRKEIKYDRETRDYAMYLDGELIGFKSTYHDAEVWLDNVVYDQIIAEEFAKVEYPVAEPPPDDSPGEPVPGLDYEDPRPRHQPVSC